MLSATSAPTAITTFSPSHSPFQRELQAGHPEQFYLQAELLPALGGRELSVERGRRRLLVVNGGQGRAGGKPQLQHDHLRGVAVRPHHHQTGPSVSLVQVPDMQTHVSSCTVDNDDV